MSDYRIVYDDPDKLDEPTKVLIPSDEWIKNAMAGNLPPINVYWELEDDEQKAILEGRHKNYKHDKSKFDKQFSAPRIGPLTEEEAIEYLIQKDIDPSVWRDYKGNRTIMKIVPVELIPSDRSFRNAWRIMQ